MQHFSCAFQSTALISVIHVIVFPTSSWKGGGGGGGGGGKRGETNRNEIKRD